MDIWIAGYASFKQMLVSSYGVTESLAHVHAGLLIFFLAALLVREHMRSILPILLVYLFAVGNELIGSITPTVLAPDERIEPWEPFLDIANTCLWPSLLFLLARRSGRRAAET